ncbi:UBX domain-containing protein [Haematococcus lacustris]|uniref:UBX domain-containing protein n=1 Tax=Haematococcus lacustris TaxID=44745 RepID=A0A699YSE4_HAELA|nr:UBX domain-containing protein [Haematococcus lacustris]
MEDNQRQRAIAQIAQVVGVDLHHAEFLFDAAGGQEDGAIQMFYGTLAVVLGTAPELEPAAQAAEFIQQFQDTDLFCHRVLCSPAVVDSTSQHVVCWGGDVRKPDAHAVRMVSACQGCGLLPEGALLALLTRTVADQGAMLVAQRAELQERDTDLFCHRVLCSPAVVDSTSQHVVCWGGDVRKPDAHAVRMVSACQGCGLLPEGALLALLTRTVADQGAMLVAQRAELQEREMARRIMSEQNADFLPDATVGHVFDFVDSLDSTNYLNYNLELPL